MLILKYTMYETIWIYRPPEKNARVLSREIGQSIEFSQILINRGITTADSAHRFLYGTLDDLLDPFLMTGMREAVDRLLQAIDQKEKVIIFGDYDVDGILSVVILSKALASFGVDVSYFIPDRLKKGYGIKEEYLEIVLERKASLVISVDCGMRAVAFASRAKEKGIDVIITDHHQPGSELPDALAVLNPVLSSANYPDKQLAGVGVVFKLIQGLFQKKGKEALLPHYLKLVSIATISDVAGLRGENRLFVKFGLKGLEEAVNPGLVSLLESCGLHDRPVTVGDVGFRMGPRINAAGRLGMTDLAIQLFFVRSREEANNLAKKLNKLNSKRQKIEEGINRQAIDQIKRNSLDQKYRFLILGSEEWHRGVIGIVASKIKDAFYRPVILFAYENGKAFGSGRSIPEFSLIDCLSESKDYLVNYGGHTLAIGCELSLDKMSAFKEAVNSYALSRLTDDVLKRRIKIDSKIDFNNINFSFLNVFSLLSPFGVGNPKPIFVTEAVQVVAEPKKLQGKHCKLLVRQNGKYFEALAWGRGDWADTIQKGDVINLCYSLQFSEYLGEEQLNLNLIDIKK